MAQRLATDADARRRRDEPLPAVLGVRGVGEPLGLLVAMDAQYPGGGWVRLAGAFRALWRAQYDAANDLQGLIKSADLARAAGFRDYKR